MIERGDVEDSLSYNSGKPRKKRAVPNIRNNKPFQLEITPEKLIIPPSGELEVSIKNPTKKKIRYWFSSDSFYFDFELKDEFKCLHGWKRVKKPLGPGETSTFTIKLRVREKTDSEKNLLYGWENAEGYFKIIQENYSDDNRRRGLEGAEKKFNPIIEEETEPVKKLKQELIEIKKVRDRQIRWREIDPKYGLPAYEVDEIDMSCPRVKKIFEFNSKIHDYPKNLKEIDEMTDKEVKEMKTKRRNGLIKEFNDFEEEYFAMLEKREEEEEEIEKKEKLEEETKLEKARKEEAKKKKSEVKPVEEPKRSVAQKPSEIKKPESTVSEVKKTNVKVDEVKPKEQGKNPVVAKKQMKKKKKNPCCVVM